MKDNQDQEFNLCKKVNQLQLEAVLEELERVHHDASLGSNYVMNSNSHAGPRLSFLERKLSQRQHRR